MYYDDESHAFKFVAGLALGAAIGAGMALLAAPQSGRRTRRRLLHAVTDARDTAGERFEDLSEDVRLAAKSGRKRLRL